MDSPPTDTLHIIDLPSPNHDARPAGCGAEMVVLHYTGMQSGAVALQRLTDADPRNGAYPGPWQDSSMAADAPLVRASAHYVVDEDGAIYRLVPEDRRAWHAGRSRWAGRDEPNDWGVGIEIVNGGHDFGLPAYPDAQIAAVSALVRDILVRNRLGPQAVVGHSDVAPRRKTDPGEHFPWQALAQAGAALWPIGPIHEDATVVAQLGDEGMATLAVQEALAAFGYTIAQDGVFDEDTCRVVMAFQRRFRPARIDGVMDQTCAAILADLSGQMARLSLAKLRS